MIVFQIIVTAFLFCFLFYRFLHLLKPHLHVVVLQADFALSLPDIHVLKIHGPNKYLLVALKVPQDSIFSAVLVVRALTVLS